MYVHRPDADGLDALLRYTPKVTRAMTRSSSPSLCAVVKRRRTGEMPAGQRGTFYRKEIIAPLNNKHFAVYTRPDDDGLDTLLRYATKAARTLQYVRTPSRRSRSGWYTPLRCCNTDVTVCMYTVQTLAVWMPFFATLRRSPEP